MPQEKPLIDRVKDYASSVHVQETPWLDLMLNDVIVELAEAERLRAKIAVLEAVERSRD